MADKLLTIHQQNLFALQAELQHLPTSEGSSPNATLGVLADALQITGATISMESVPIYCPSSQAWQLSLVLTADFGNAEAENFVLLTTEDHDGFHCSHTLAALASLVEAIQTDVKEENCRFAAKGKAVVFFGVDGNARATSAAWFQRHHEELATHCFLHLVLDSLPDRDASPFVCGSPLTRSLWHRALLALEGNSQQQKSAVSIGKDCDRLGIPSLFAFLPADRAPKNSPEDTVAVDFVRYTEMIGDALCRALMEGCSCLDVAAGALQLRDVIQQQIQELRQSAQVLGQHNTHTRALCDAFLRADTLLLLPLQSELLTVLLEEKPLRNPPVALIHSLERARFLVNHTGLFQAVREIAAQTRAILSTDGSPQSLVLVWNSWATAVNASQAVNHAITNAIAIVRSTKPAPAWRPLL